MKKLFVAVSLSLLLLTTFLSDFKTNATTTAASRSYVVTVSAGQFNRQNTVVTFALPKDAKEKLYRLRDYAGKEIPLQINAQREASFILSELSAGEKRSYRLEPTRSVGQVSAAEGVEVKREKESLRVTVAGREVLQYRIDKRALSRTDIKPIFQRAGVIHPINSPAGRTITDSYPPNHLHHHGIWSAWTKTEFQGRKPDFWNMGEGTGTVEFDSLIETWGGPVNGGFQSRHRFIDLKAPSPVTVLNEIWEVRVYRVAQGKRPLWMFDLTSTQTTATQDPLVLPEYHYGGIGFRGNRQWDGKENTFFLTSEGKDRSNGHATRARWCHISGRVDGELAGIAILGHPENFRAPQPMRIHPTEPFFNYAPSQLGKWEIVPGKPYIARYRYIVSDGPADKQEIERLWNDYANPPEVSITNN